MKLPTPTITEEMIIMIYQIIKDRNYERCLNNSLLSLPLFKEEVEELTEYLINNPQADEEKVRQTLYAIIDKMNEKLGLDAYQRDKYYPPIAIDYMGATERMIEDKY